MKICDSCRASYPRNTALPKDGTTLRFSSDFRPAPRPRNTRSGKDRNRRDASVYRASTWPFNEWSR